MMAALVLASSCTADKAVKADYTWKIQSIRYYDPSYPESVNTLVLTYDEQGRVTRYADSYRDEDGIGESQNVGNYVYQDNSNSVLAIFDYGKETYQTENGLLSRIDYVNEEYDFGSEEHFNYENGKITDSWFEGGESCSSSEYVWDGDDIQSITGSAEGCTEKSVFTYTDKPNCYSYDLSQSFNFRESAFSGLSLVKGMRSAHLPSEVKHYESYFDENDEEVTELSSTETFSYESDDEGRVTKVTKIIFGSDWSYVTVYEINY